LIVPKHIYNPPECFFSHIRLPISPALSTPSLAVPTTSPAVTTTSPAVLRRDPLLVRQESPLVLGDWMYTL
jgi:hypothetical protein